MNRGEHARRADFLLNVESVRVKAELSKAVTEAQRDARGKQLHGIWLQAQAHATLASIADLNILPGYEHE